MPYKCELTGDDDTSFTENGTRFPTPENFLGVQVSSVELFSPSHKEILD